VKARVLHPWRVSHAQAAGIQDALRPRLVAAPLPKDPRLVAGADVAYSRRTHRVYAAVVVVELPSLETVESVGVTRTATFPYIPGLLSFREVPPLLEAFERLVRRPDVLVFDGQGLAHPRRFGLACHAGLLLDAPSIGCAKTRLVGEHGPVPGRRGASVPLRAGGETIGAVVRTREGVNPVFVSPGHRADTPSAVGLVVALAARYRLPEPQRRAHHATVALHARDRGRPAAGVRTHPDFVPKRPR
jgi:deoxyribonuclease V